MTCSRFKTKPKQGLPRSVKVQLAITSSEGGACSHTDTATPEVLQDFEKTPTRLSERTMKRTQVSLRGSVPQCPVRVAPRITCLRRRPTRNSLRRTSEGTTKSPALLASRRNRRPRRGPEPSTTRQPSSGMRREARHPFSGPTCPGRPGTVRRHRPSSPRPAERPPTTTGGTTRRNSDLRFLDDSGFRRKSCPPTCLRVRGFSRIVCPGVCRAAPASLVSDVALEPLLSREDPRTRQFPSQILSRANLDELTLSLKWGYVFTVLHVQFHTEFEWSSLPSPLGEGCIPRVIVYADASRRGNAFYV